MNFYIIAYFISNILRMAGLFMLPPLCIAMFQKESPSIKAFALSIFLCLLFSLIPYLFPVKKKVFYAKEGFVTVGLAWIVVSFFGALPFYISGSIPDFIDCFFETVSGFTTTGASVLTNVEALPMSMLYWRSFTHWLGGMGVLVFLLAVTPFTKNSGHSVHLLRAESPGPQVGKLVPRLQQTAKILYGIYVCMTIVEVLLLLAGGMPLFDSVAHAFGTAGTGGFGIKNDSIAGYSPYLQIVITIFMTLFGVNFNLFYLLLLREYKKALFNEELHLYLGIMFLSICIISWNILPLFQGNLGTAFQQAAFQVSSVMTTTGYATTDFNLWPQLSRVLLVILMFFGASAGSTGGGIKMARILIIAKAAKIEIQKMLHPNSVKLLRINADPVDQSTLHNVFIYLTIYFGILIFSTIIITCDNFSLETSFTATISCLNNIGPGLDLIGPAGNYHAFSFVSKLTLAIVMLIGRLEIFPIVMLVMPSVWKRSWGRKHDIPISLS